jgi:hypothetical protein
VDINGYRFAALSPVFLIKKLCASAPLREKKKRLTSTIWFRPQAGL